jgi:hypothetical protein
MPLLWAYGAGERAKDIVDDCERMCANPKLNLDPATDLEPIAGALNNAPAYRWLDDIIRSLYLRVDWHFAITAVTLTVDPDILCICLPADFWRVAYTNPLYLMSTTGRKSLNQITRPQFFDNTSLHLEAAPNEPRDFFVDRGAGVIRLWPIPDQIYVFELHYFKLVPGLNDIIDVPVFPYRDYLRASLLVRYYQDQDDNRLAYAEQERQSLWREIRGTNYDLREEPGSTLGYALDPHHFRSVQFDD